MNPTILTTYFFIASLVVNNVFAESFEPFLGKKWVFSSSKETEIIQFETELSGFEVLYGISSNDSTKWSLTHRAQFGYDLFYNYIDGDIGKESHFKFQEVTNKVVSGVYYLFSFKSVFNMSKSKEIPMIGTLLEKDCTVVFNPVDGQLQVPCVTVINSSATFDAVMEQITVNPIEFKVITLNKK